MGKFGVGKLNDNGLHLLLLAVTNKFVIGKASSNIPIAHNPAGDDSAILKTTLFP